jgi:hypothetical protein
MQWLIITVIALFEIVAIIAIIRLWRQKRRHWASKLFWSVLLVIPVFGLLFYGFITITPEAQEDHTEDRIGADAGGFH